MLFALPAFFIVIGVFMSTLLASLVVFAATMGIYMSVFTGYFVAVVMILFL